MRHRLYFPALTIFLLFFGVAMLDAVRARAWLEATLWLAFGALFFGADAYHRSHHS